MTMKFGPTVNNRKKGFTLVELVVSMGIGAVILAAAMGMFNLVQNYSKNHQKNAYSDTIAQELSETLTSKIAKGSVITFYPLSATAFAGTDFETYDVYSSSLSSKTVTAIVIAKDGNGNYRLYNYGDITSFAGVTGVVDTSYTGGKTKTSYKLTEIMSVVDTDRESYAMFDEAYYNRSNYVFTFEVGTSLKPYINLTEETFKCDYDNKPTTETLNVPRKTAFQIMSSEAKVTLMPGGVGGYTADTKGVTTAVTDTVARDELLILVTSGKPYETPNYDYTVWRNDITYVAGEHVFFQGVLYEALTGNTDSKPSLTNSNWVKDWGLSDLVGSVTALPANFTVANVSQLVINIEIPVPGATSETETLDCNSGVTWSGNKDNNDSATASFTTTDGNWKIAFPADKNTDGGNRQAIISGDYKGRTFTSIPFKYQISGGASTAATTAPGATTTDTTSPGATTTTSSTITEWKADGTQYSVGDKVTYKGKTYECLRVIRGQTGWEPSSASMATYWKELP